MGTNERRAAECSSTIANGGSFSSSGNIGTISSDCAQTSENEVTYSANSCPGCTVTVDGKITFLEPPDNLGCSRDEINAANPCVTSTITEESTMTSTGSSTSTSTSTSTTESESKCIINGKEMPCEDVPMVVTENTNKGTSGAGGAKIASASAIAILSVAVALM